LSFFSSTGIDRRLSSELDEEMLSSNAKQKWKAAASKKDCRDAYRRALAEMDVADKSRASRQA
jgi:hypothetical protein